MNKIKIIIPARFNSRRFPGKPLALIFNIPMIIRVANIANKVTTKDNIIIATDNKKIYEVAQKYNFRSIITDKKCLTGTDRVAEVASKLNANVFINLQGDEPLVSYSDIKKVINAKIKNKNFIICGYSKILKQENPESNSIPKVVMNEKNELVYISRSLIPGSKKKINKFYKQVCIYAFNKKELLEFKRFSRKSKLEKIEDIEILRFFEINKKVKMVELSHSSIAVDYPDDIKKVEKKIRQ